MSVVQSAAGQRPSPTRHLSRSPKRETRAGRDPNDRSSGNECRAAEWQLVASQRPLTPTGAGRFLYFGRHAAPGYALMRIQLRPQQDYASLAIKGK